MLNNMYAYLFRLQPQVSAWQIRFAIQIVKAFWTLKLLYRKTKHYTYTSKQLESYWENKLRSASLLVSKLESWNVIGYIQNDHHPTLKRESGSTWTLGHWRDKSWDLGGEDTYPRARFFFGQQQSALTCRYIIYGNYNILPYYMKF